MAGVLREEVGITFPPRELDFYHIGRLRASAEGLGYDFAYYPEIPTTMNVVESVAVEEGFPKPFVALANHQTAGVGRPGREWHDKHGASILMSILHTLPAGEQRRVAVLADLVALRTATVLSDASERPVQIKYPNDIVFDGAKLSGILVRNIYDRGTYRGTNIGIGVNVHYADDELANYPLDYPATSVDAITGSLNSREQLVTSLLSELRYTVSDTLAIAYNTQDQIRFNDLWRGKSAVLDQDVSIFSGDEILTSGRVVNTKMGEGILLESAQGMQWHNLFNSNMKVRMK